MKQTIAIILCALTALSLFASCAKTPTDEEITTTETETETATATIEQEEPTQAPTLEPATETEETPTAEPVEESNAEIYSAYYELLEKLIDEHGVCETIFGNNGLWLAKLMDLDNDGVEELIYYLNTYELDYYSGYVVYEYDKETKSVELSEDHRDRTVELYAVSIYKGQDEKIYVKNYNGQSDTYWGDYCTKEDGIWKKVFEWNENIEENIEENSVDDSWGRFYSYNGLENVDEATAKKEFEKYEAELIYEFLLYSWEDDIEYTNNIYETLQEIADKIN